MSGHWQPTRYERLVPMQREAGGVVRAKGAGYCLVWMHHGHDGQACHDTWMWKVYHAGSAQRTSQGEEPSAAAAFEACDRALAASEIIAEAASPPAPPPDFNRSGKYPPLRRVK